MRPVTRAAVIAMTLAVTFVAATSAGIARAQAERQDVVAAGLDDGQRSADGNEIVNDIVADLGSDDPVRIRRAAERIRELLWSEPGATVDRLNAEWMGALQRARQYRSMAEIAVEATTLVPADTWRIEQLLRHRVTALLELRIPGEALGAAKELYNVSSLSFLPTALELLAASLKAAHPNDPRILSRFKLQQLALAQTDPKQRAKETEGLGASVLAGIRTDPGKWEKAISQRLGKEKDDFRMLCATGNLLLLADRVEEARKAFERAYAVAPPSERRYASEGLAKVLKAEDGGVGRANAWVMSIRPKDLLRD